MFKFAPRQHSTTLCIAPTQMSMSLYWSLQSSYRIATLNCLLQQNIQTIFYAMHAICKTPTYIEILLHCGEGRSLLKKVDLTIFFNQDLVISSNLYHVDI